MFPLTSQHLIKSKQLRRSVHLIEVLVVLVCGLLPSVIIISTSGYQYIGFPPVCTNEIPGVLFYTLKPGIATLYVNKYVFMIFNTDSQNCTPCTDNKAITGTYMHTCKYVMLCIL